MQIRWIWDHYLSIFATMLQQCIEQCRILYCWVPFISSDYKSLTSLTAAPMQRRAEAIFFSQDYMNCKEMSTSGSPPSFNPLLCALGLCFTVYYISPLCWMFYPNITWVLSFGPNLQPSLRPIWLDVFSFCFVFFSSSYCRSPTVLHLLFHSISVSTPLLPLLLCSL